MPHAESTPHVTPKTCQAIAFIAAVDPRTVASLYSGDRAVLPHTAARIAEAARELGLPAPPAARVRTRRTRAQIAAALAKAGAK